MQMPTGDASRAVGEKSRVESRTSSSRRRSKRGGVGESRRREQGKSKRHERTAQTLVPGLLLLLLLLLLVQCNSGTNKNNCSGQQQQEALLPSVQQSVPWPGSQWHAMAESSGDMAISLRLPTCMDARRRTQRRTYPDIADSCRSTAAAAAAEHSTRCR